MDSLFVLSDLGLGIFLLLSLAALEVSVPRVELGLCAGVVRLQQLKSKHINLFPPL